MLFSPETSMAISTLPSPSSATLEMEVTWDSRIIRSELRLAIYILSQRGLKLAQKWASEQLMGLQRGGGAVELSSEAMQPFEEYLSQPQEDVVLYAKSLMDLGEYAHAAAVLSRPFKGKLVLTMTDPLPNLSPFGIYLRAYALYLAGERCKEEEMLELQRYQMNERTNVLFVLFAPCSFIGSLTKTHDRLAIFWSATHSKNTKVLGIHFWDNFVLIWNRRIRIIVWMPLGCTFMVLS